MKEKEHRFDGHLRKETWIHPEDGCRVHRTAPLDPFTGHDDSSEDEELQQLIPSEVSCDIFEKLPLQLHLFIFSI